MTESLTIHPAYLAVAVALLWFPRSWLRSGKRILRKRHKPDDALERLAGVGAKDLENKAVQLGREFGNSRNYIDLFRALAGAYSLGHFAFNGAEGNELRILGIQGGIVLVAALIQAIRYDKRLSFYAPIFFNLGMSTGLSGDYTCLFAFAMVLAVNLVIPNPRWFLTVFGVLMLPVGFVFDSDLATLGLLSGAILLVPLLSLLTKRPLVVFTKKRKNAGAG